MSGLVTPEEMCGLSSIPPTLLGSPTSPQSDTRATSLLLRKCSGGMKTRSCAVCGKPQSRRRYQIEASHVLHGLLTPHLTTTCTCCPMASGGRRKGKLRERYLFGICRDTLPSPPRGGGKGLSLASPGGTCSCRWARSAYGKRRSCGPSAGFESPAASERLRCPAKRGDRETGSFSIVVVNLQQSPSRLHFALKPRADVPLGTLQRACGPGDCKGIPKLHRAS